VEALSPEERTFLLDALERRQRKEDLETSLGKALRRKKGSYDLYISIMAKVREEARRNNVSKDEAARALTAQE